MVPFFAHSSINMFTQAQLIVLFSCNMSTNCHLATAAYDHISCVELLTERRKSNYCKLSDFGECSCPILSDLDISIQSWLGNGMQLNTWES